jgi:hypothetical protein
LGTVLVWRRVPSRSDQTGTPRLRLHPWLVALLFIGLRETVEGEARLFRKG